MKAALLISPEKITLGDIPEPPLKAGNVLIQPAYAGICGTDVSFYLGHRPVPYPFVLGHEVTGSVVGIDAAMKKLHVGQRVIVEPNYPCGACQLCLKGRGAVCAQKTSMGVNLPGCFAECVTAPAEYVWPLPDAVSDRDAATIEPLTVSLHALMQSGAKIGDTVAVLGCGVVGLLLIHVAVAEGVRVIAHDRFPDKLIAVFECAGVSATVELALKAAPRGASVILLGLSAAPASFVPMRLVREGVNILTSMIYDHPADFAYAIDMVSRGVLHPACVVTDTYSFESISQALEHACTGKAGKIHIKMT
jgi:threonine dehydrogenase-like Zn-dependent dehydrogenase